MKALLIPMVAVMTLTFSGMSFASAPAAGEKISTEKKNEFKKVGGKKAHKEAKNESAAKKERRKLNAKK